MLAAPTLEALARAWASRLGCSPSELATAGTVVMPHGEDLVGYHGIEVLRRGPACVVSAPAPLVTELRRRLQGLDADGLLAPETLVARLGAEKIARVIGPALYSYVDAGCLRAGPGPETRPVAPEDRPALDALVRACPAQEWDESSLEVDHPGLMGCFIEGRLVSLAGASRFCGELMNLGVVTHPGFRRAGYAKAALRAAARRVLDSGSIPQHRTLVSHQASIGLAQSLGFEPWGKTLALRLC